MNSYGIKGPLIKWFENYLYQRKQKVINRATSSTVCEVSPEVLQGSVLGPLLFLIYINDIGEKLLFLSRLFANDTSLGYSSQNVVEIANVINHDLCELNTWSTKWLMSFNPDKTHLYKLKIAKGLKQTLGGLQERLHKQLMMLPC
jgi:hypothetical protein